jgi:ERF superfamily
MKVYQAINSVQRALCTDGIGKSRKNAQQGYSFRGIDDIYNAVSPLLGQHGLCILPRVLSRECVERQNKSGGALFYVTCEVEFDFVSSEDGTKHTVKTYGEAMDSADKATNKAMSAAYKYAVMQAFAIPTEGDNDADAHTHEVVPSATTAPRKEMTPAQIARDMDARIKKGELAIVAHELAGMTDKLMNDIWNKLDPASANAINDQWHGVTA